MRLNVLIAGKAGQGINEISNILAKSLASIGYYVFNYRDYGSYITGGHNFNILSISDAIIRSYGEEFDFVIALDENAVKKHKLKEKTIVLASQNYKVKNLVKIEIENKKIENVYYAAVLFKILGLGKEILKNYINKVFAGKSLLKEDLEAVDKVYSKNYKFSFNLKPGNKKNIVMTGAEAVGIGAIESGLQVYFAYPMTPATSMLVFLAQNEKKYNYLVYEPENEISVINAGLGASFSNAAAMVGTSGGGFDLMTEALSMAGMAEIPIVVYLATRPGPSTGVPTFTSQQDINLAVYAGHGEFSRIVVCPGDLQEAYELTKEIFYLTGKYRCPGIILVDKHFAESWYSAESINYKKYPDVKIKYKLGKEIFKTSSYEHDEKGNTVESALEVKKAADRRLKKQEEIKREIGKMKTFEIYGKGEKIIIGTGSVKGAVLDALPELKGFSYLHIRYLEPFADISSLIKGKEIYVIENNSRGLLADLIQKNLGIKIPGKNRVLKYDGRQFLSKEILERLG
jgi:2-oxoglutarate ferredoxin oxidoreductase subunit alpha